MAKRKIVDAPKYDKGGVMAKSPKHKGRKRRVSKKY